MRVVFFPPESVTEPRHWVRHDQAFAMMLRPGSIECGPKRSALETFDYGAGDLALCHRHEGEWVGLMNVLHLRGSQPERHSHGLPFTSLLRPAVSGICNSSLFARASALRPPSTFLTRPRRSSFQLSSSFPQGKPQTQV